MEGEGDWGTGSEGRTERVSWREQQGAGSHRPVHRPQLLLPFQRLFIWVMF